MIVFTRVKRALKSGLHLCNDCGFRKPMQNQVSLVGHSTKFNIPKVTYKELATQSVTVLSTCAVTRDARVRTRNNHISGISYPHLLFTIQLVGVR